MKLYVSDLDGTLLNSKKEVSNYSKVVLNNLIEKGANFTIATARTPGTVIDLLDGLNINMPMVLMNGVIIYDIKNKKYLQFKKIHNSTAEKIISIVDKLNENIFMYTIEDNKIIVYYNNLKLRFDKQYYSERVSSSYKTFKNIKTYNEIAKAKDVVNIVIMNTLDIIKPLYEKLKVLEGIYINYCQDIYNKDCYFLEIHSDLASKANGIKELSKYINYNELICFGDNTNDKSMFEIANRAYATANAVDSIKKISTETIDTNDNDGVAKFLAKEFYL